MALSDVQIRNAAAGDKVRKLTDGDGLYLVVTDKGSKLWRMDYRFQGRRNTLSFGKYPTIGLAAARSRRDAARLKIASGIDPRAETLVERDAAALAKSSSLREV